MQGNIYSVVNALNRLNIEPVITDNAEELLSADHVIFPGREASTTMAYIKAHKLDMLIRDLNNPFLAFALVNSSYANIPRRWYWSASVYFQ